MPELKIKGLRLDHSPNCESWAKKEIVDLSDFLYRAHWATRQNGIDGSVEIGKINPDVVQEWHYAINWLTRYGDYEDWDEITTDT